MTTLQPPVRKRRKLLSPFRTKDKVLEGLRAAAVTIWQNNETLLPAGTPAYQAAIMAHEPITGNQVRRLFPAPTHVMAHFKTMIDAWAAVGFTVVANPDTDSARILKRITDLRAAPRLPNRTRGSQAPPLTPVKTAKRSATTGRLIGQGGARVSSLTELPTEGLCLLCELTKPLEEMVVVHLRKERLYQMRPRCKKCHNDRERGHRREWKRNYQRAWRAKHKKLDKSYRDNDPNLKQNTRERMARRFNEKHYALLIQGRLRRRLNLHISTAEAEKLLDRFGPCYPSQIGLTDEGRKRVERLRSSMRSKQLPYKTVELRMLVYEEGSPFVIPPEAQPLPYQSAADKLRLVQAERRRSASQKAA